MKQWLLYPAMASAVTLVLHFAVGLRFGISALAAFVGWPLIGTLVTADDDLPGGWSNPDGTVKPPWRTGLFWGQLAGGFAVSAFVGALEVGVLTQTGVAFALAGIGSASVAMVLLRHHCRAHASQRIEPGH